jgi:hypothetical protein
VTATSVLVADNPCCQEVQSVLLFW